MAEFLSRERLDRIADIRPEAEVIEPVVRQDIDRGFELPTGLYVATVVAYLAFLGVLASAFMNPGLAIPMAICVLFVFAAFGTPMAWVRMRSENRRQAMRFQTFMNQGIQTATGHLDGGAAAVQVLILPVLILFWGICVAVVAALV